MTKIKICGITNDLDAIKCVALGADALGFIFAKSKRQVTKEKAREIIEKLPPFVAIVGVFVDEKEDVVRKIQSYCGLTALQFHGNESPQYCSGFSNVVKAISVNDEINQATINDYESCVSAFLFDTYSENQKGGTGKAFDWNILRRIETKKPIILAGGITIETIADAIREVKPYAIDCVSGTETSPGKKDYEKTKKIIEVCKL